MLMVCLIIVCLHSGRQRLWLGEGARRPACWHQPGLRALFFVGMARRPVRPAMKGNTETHTARGNEDGVARFGLCLFSQQRQWRPARRRHLTLLISAD